MPIKVKDPTTTMNKWDTNAGNATGSYQAGINAPKQSQSAAAIAAAPRWQQSVSSPDALARFTGRLQKAGDAAWSAGALGKGKDRYAGGIHAAKAKFQTNVTPFLTAIAGVNLPDKGIRGSAQNYARVQAVGDALHALKVSRAGQ
jgi:hypothetical protein